MQLREPRHQLSFKFTIAGSTTVKLIMVNPAVGDKKLL